MLEQLTSNNREPKRPFNMRTRLGLLLSAAVALTWSVQAQVSLYNFSQSQQTWTEITAGDGGYQLGTPTFFPPQHNLRAYADPAIPEGTVTNGGYLSPAVGPGYPIGFNFLFNGDVFDRIGVANGGWISFGKSSDGAQAVWCFTSDHPAGRPLVQSYGGPAIPYQRNRVAGFGLSSLRAQDQSSVGGPTSSLRVATLGTAPNRVCVIQWKDFRTNYSVDNNRINFQIRLNEADNSVEVRFGPMEWEWYQGGAGNIQVGLGGQSSTDFNNRMTVYEEPTFNHDWNTTQAGVSNTSVCVAGNPTASQAEGPGVYPVVGLSYKWSAPVCPPPAWPVTLTEVTFQSAVLTWSSVPGAASYDYVVSTEPDPNTASPVASGNTTATTMTVNGLDPLTTYYVYVRSRCGGQPGIWGNATQLRTQGGAVVVCGEPAIQQTHCSSQNTTVTWHYSTSDGVSPVRVSFFEGYVGSVTGGSFWIYDGPNDTSPEIYEAGWGDVLPGQVFTSTGPDLFMKLVTDNGSCESQPWYTPWEWTVGCLDCTSPLAAYTVVDEDCENFQYSVQVLVASIGSSPNVVISNSQGVASTTVTTPGVYVVGPFTAGTPVTITVENPVNDLCSVSSVELVNTPCAIVGCGPTEYTYCYENTDNSQWLYQGEGAPLGIRFRRGSTFGSDRARIYNGSDPFSSSPTDLSGSLANSLVTSTNAANALFVEVNSDGVLSCEDGYAAEWEYVVACYDGCTQPVASFSSACISSTQYMVTVTITEIGSAGSVSITNDGGAATVSATAAGTYTVGPFASASTVTLEVEGASVLCSWTSPEQFRDCAGVGMEELQANTLQLYPNPSEGHFRLDLPATVSGDTELRVLDLQGRVLVRRGAVQAQGRTLELDLSGFPNGSYIVTLSSGQGVHTGKVQVVH